MSGINPFDLDAFFGMVKRTHKWQCPHTMKDSSLEVSFPPLPSSLRPPPSQPLYHPFCTSSPTELAP